jgi:hypothetical protein
MHISHHDILEQLPRENYLVCRIFNKMQESYKRLSLFRYSGLGPNLRLFSFYFFHKISVQDMLYERIYFYL